MLHVSLLGEQVITDDVDGRVRTRSSRTIALVAYLVMHAGAPQARQLIAGLFWPESTDSQALTNLRRELHHLRHVLPGEPSLLVTSKDLCWRDTEFCLVDVRVFGAERRAAIAAAADGDTSRALAHAISALAAYRGELLPGVYDDWLLEVRSELERQCVDLCDLTCEVGARTGHLGVAADAARRRIHLQPLEEVGYRTLMELQSDLGDRAGAISTYHHCASVLEQELGVEPGEVTTRTLHRLIASDNAPVSTVLAERPASRSGLARADLVGRRVEFELLQELWQAAARGHPQVAIVRGDAGVGKTRLVHEAAAVARAHGAAVATAQCFGTSGRLALAPVADWLRDPVLRAARSGLEPVWRVEVDRLVPSAETRPGSAAAGSRAMADAWQRHRFFEGLARAVLCGGRPTLLVLDNLQWCDEETLSFVTFLVGLAPEAPLMLALTVRDDDLDEDRGLTEWVSRIRAAGILTVVSLAPLDESRTALLAEELIGHPPTSDDAALLHATTGGFPLYIVEATRGAVGLGHAELPVGDLAAVLRIRLEQATAPAREIAGLAAAVGRDFTLDLLSEASDLEADTVVRALDELWRRRIVLEFRDGYDFSHDLLRETAYARVSPPQRWLLHRRLAQSLELLHSDSVDTVVAQLAEQYALGGRPERALAYYRRAAEVAAGMFAHAEVIRLHHKALEIVGLLPAGRDRDGRELDLLETMAPPLNALHGYASPLLQATLERSVDLAERLGRKDVTLRSMAGLWASRFVQGHIADAHRIATRALFMVDAASELSGPAHFAFAGSAVSLGMPEEALQHFELAGELTPGAFSLSVGTRLNVHARAWAAHAHWLRGHDDEALGASLDAIGLARAIDHPYSLAVALAYAGITHQLRRDVDRVRSTATELRTLCDRYGFAYYGEWGMIVDGWSRLDGPGVRAIQRGIDNLKSIGAFARMPYWLSLQADAYRALENHDAVRAVLDAALVTGRARSDLWWLPEVLRMRAAYDDEVDAVSRLQEAAGLARGHGSVMLASRCEQDLAERGVGVSRRSVPATS